MILVDTSVWADHFRRLEPEMSRLIEGETVLQHPFVTGELALGNPKDRKMLVTTLESLPQADVLGWNKLLGYVERYGLGGTGIGYVDAHLLAATHSHRAKLWSRDKRLAFQAERLGLAYQP